MSSNIPFDICVQIIKRLPIKSLIQFRSVCKAWKSFIDSSQFITGYSFRHTQPQHLMIRYQVGYWKEKEVKYVCFVDDDSFPQQNFALTAPPFFQGTMPIGSSHGLLCLTCCFREPGDSSGTEMAVIWNPAIRKWIAVAVPALNGDVVHHLFDYVLGFGVCPDTKDPKLVMITNIDESTNPSQVMVFTLSSGEWKTPCSNVPRRSIEFTGSQTVIGQFIYWNAYAWSDGERRNLIMSFDMSTEEFREIDLPNSLADESELDMCRLRESLVLLDYNNDRETTKKFVCDVWMMEHGDSRAFTKLFTINAPNVSLFRTLGFRNSGEPIAEMKMKDDDGIVTALVVYEPCSEHIRDLGILGSMSSFFGSSYTESLLLLNHDDGQIIR